MSGTAASYVSALPFAAGETMAVTSSTGLRPRVPYDPDVLGKPADSSRTITAAMVHIAGADPLGGVTDEAMFALGMTRFATTSSKNVLAELVGRRFREARR